jgi:hypothetical protein
MIERKAEMRFNAVFADLVDEESLSDVSRSDLPDLFRWAVDDGWTFDERGAWLLRRFLATYSGSPESFSDVTGWEAAVNGRAVPDLDLFSDGKTRATTLARRGVAFARAALYRLNTDYPDHPPGVSYISLSEVDMEDETLYVGDVTFVTAHEGEPPYLSDLESVTGNAVLAIESAECREPIE